ncbi:MAG: peptide ABC transporter substrate-binding protein [Gammaproteobacteria bacterium]|nr:peptide ABC transporter substrate-binding protein [Gammaproteobacteria bacterium]
MRSESNVEVGRQKQILHFGNGDEPQGLDPTIVTGIPEWHIIQALFEGLVAKDPATLEIRPGVAESWTISGDQKIYTFRLRREARWSDGDPVTAGDFVFTWKRALIPTLGNPYAYMFNCIRGAKTFFEGRNPDFGQVGVKALDDRTLQVELETPTPYFLQLLDHHSYYPVQKKTIEKFGAVDEPNMRWTRPENIVGNGPFTLKEWILNRVVIVEKNPLYWDAARVKLWQIYFYPIPNASTEERMFRAQQLHVTDRVPADKLAVYRENDPDSLHVTPYLGTYFYRLNSNVKPLDDVRVRRALAMSIDRRQLVEKIAKGGQQPAYTLTPPNTAGYTSYAKLPHDAQKAQELLAEAGYPGGRGFPRLELMYNTDELHRKVATAIQQMWKKSLNIDITLLSQDWKVFMDRETHLHYQMSRGSWIGDYLDPTTFLDMFIAGSGNNRTGWSNPRYDELLKQATRTGDREERYALLRAAEAILVEEAPIIPLYTYTQMRLISTDLRGWDHNVLDQHPFKYLYLEAPREAERKIERH